MNTEPLWLKDHQPSGYPPLGSDITVDVLVAGGGIAGVTAAYLIAKEGYSVALVERGLIGGRETGHTTAHLTYMTDTRLSDIVSAFSRDAARRAWEAGRDAIEFIATAVESEEIDCAFERVPGYLVCAEGSDLKKESALLRSEALVATQLGFPTHFIELGPVTRRPGIFCEGQAKFHPVQYLRALAQRAVESGALIFENTELGEFPDEAGKAAAGSHTITFKHVFIATHVPLQGDASTLGAASFQTKLALYSTYAVGAGMPKGALAPMIWSDTGDPFLYLRIERGEETDYCILGGEDHRTGQEDDTGHCFQRLEERLLKWFPDARLADRWSGQVVETVDGLPFIGPTSDQQFIATGFSGNGMTFGTAAALMFRDHLKGVTNPFSELFSAGRKTASALGTFLSENKDFPVRLVTDRLEVEEGDPEKVAPGEGKVLEHGGHRLAVYRSENGELTRCSAVCPHLGCIVAWNPAEATWDCPCHGSRFEAMGKVIAGPAEDSLERLSG
ncbi:FAD-dependent oxidoreductase [Luteolibacter soli]|uniref:FAD-dependent oxidoreductase n=1 Tax=Luteolibacter soli TaxID=3135280 RepID=A0ABU9B2T8_9BACT